MKPNSTTLRSAMVAFLAFASVASAVNRVDVEERTLPAAAAEKLVCETVDADVTVQTHEADAVRVMIRREVMDLPDEATVEAALAALETIFEDRGDHIFLQSKLPQNRKQWKKKTGRDRVNYTLSYEIWVPADFSLDTHTVDGDIAIAAIGGDCHFNTVDGEINVAACADLKGQTVDGDIIAREVKGGATVQTVDGDIEVTFVGDGMQDSRLRTVDGEIVVRLAAGVGVSLAAQAVDGEVSVDAELENMEKRHNRIAGDLNGGGVRLRLQSVDGSIRVTD